MFHFFNKRNNASVVGLEVRTNGLAFVRMDSKAKSATRQMAFQCFAECKAAEREKVLKALVAESNSHGARCNLVLSGNQYHLVQLEKPAVEEDELRSAVHWKLPDLVSLPADDLISDIFHFPEDGSRGRQLINAVCARKSSLLELIELIRESGLELNAIDVIDFALRNLSVLAMDDTGKSAEGAKPQSQQMRPLGIIYACAHYSLLVVVKEMNLYLSRKLNIREQDIADPASQENAVQQLALEVQRSLDYFESQMRQAPPMQILMHGPNIQLPLPQLLDPLFAASVDDMNFEDVLAEQSNEALTTLVQTLGALGGALRAESV